MAQPKRKLRLVEPLTEAYDRDAARARVRAATVPEASKRALDRFDMTTQPQEVWWLFLEGRT